MKIIPINPLTVSKEGKFMGLFKNKLYSWLVLKNENVRKDYQGYVISHPGEHKKNRMKSWILMLKLIWHYRVLRKKTPYFKNGKGVGAANAAKGASPAKPKVELPFINGSESAGIHRLGALYFAKDLLKYDVISFDIFDTLLLRPFAIPSDLFHVLGNRLNIMDFYKIRREAEKEARAEAIALNGNHEVTIYDIYKKINLRTGLDIDEGVEAELQAEIDFCFGNPYMLRVFKLLKEYNKTIIIASDMYFPHDMMERLLASCGYTQYSELYVSCDYMCNKRQGGLYKNIIHKYSGKKIVHIGDNFTSDIQSARSMGIDAIYYKNCHEMGRPYRPTEMSELVGSVYSGIVNTHLHNGIQTYNPYYEYGFIYGGLYVLGYCNWIYQKAKKEGIDKILFLSRDGVIYQRVFNLMFSDIPNEYVYWSRIANLKYTSEINRNDNLIRMVTHKAYNVIPESFAEILSSFGLEQLIPKLKEHQLDEEWLLTPEYIKTFERFLIANWDEIIEINEREVAIVEKSLKKTIGDNKKIAVVDVGWAGSGPLGIKYLVENKWKMDCEVFCYVAGSRDGQHTKVLNDLHNNNVEPYLFSRMYNRNLYDFHTQTNKGTNCIYFEIFTQACSPSFKGLTADEGFNFDIPEVENYEMIKDIHEGIVEFAKKYLAVAQKDKYLLNISGYDAYLAFQNIIKNLSFIKKHFKDFSYARNVAGNGSVQRIETISDILKKCKL